MIEVGLQTPANYVKAFLERRGAMSSNQQKKGSRRFFAKQVLLLVITIILVVFFTVPLLKTVKSALNPGELTAKVESTAEAASGLHAKLNVVRSEMLMGAGDEKAQEKLKKQVEELKRQIAMKEKENKHLQDEVTMVQTLLHVVKPSAATVSTVPSIDFGQKVIQFLTQVFGCVASLFSGGMFVFSWLKNRRAAPQNAEE